MKKDFYNILVFGVLILAASLLATSCSVHISKRETSGEKLTQTFDVKESFSGIRSLSAVKIVYSVSDSISVRAEGPENFVKNMSVTVDKDSMLVISSYDKSEEGDFMRGFFDGVNMSIDDCECVVYISGPNVGNLDFKGATTFTTRDTLNVSSMMINVSGASDIDIKNIVAGEFKVVSSGSSEIDVDWLKAEKVTIDTSGASDIKMGLVGVKNTTFVGRGASEAEFDFTDCDSAKIDIQGAGEVELKGTLRHLDKKVAGAGDIDDDKLTIN